MGEQCGDHRCAIFRGNSFTWGVIPADAIADTVVTVVLSVGVSVVRVTIIIDITIAVVA